MQDLLKQQDHNVIVLVEFAIALMTILDQINRDSFQRFKLRIGRDGKLLHNNGRNTNDTRANSKRSRNEAQMALAQQTSYIK